MSTNPVEFLSELVAIESLSGEETAVAHLPQLTLPASEVERLLVGQRLVRETDHALHEMVRVTDPTGEFVGILRAEADYWQPHKMFLPETAVVDQISLI